MKNRRSKADPSAVRPNERCSSGVEGLDNILNGGLPRDCFYLVQGDPGSGKTTLALQFLLEGVRCGEPVFYITLSETHEELLKVTRSMAGRWKVFPYWNDPPSSSSCVRKRKQPSFILPRSN